MTAARTGGRDVDVAIVGAGAAGLAAAARARDAGLSTLILEASAAIGGRARTSTPDLFEGEILDEGAAWLHDPARNPLAALARASGADLRDAFGDRDHRLFVDRRPATEAERRDYAAADAEWRALLEARSASGPDCSVAAAAPGFRETNPWAASLEHWEATIIAAADPEELGLRDWAANTLPDGDLLPQAGVGKLLVDLLAPRAGRIARGMRVTDIDRRPADHVAVTTQGGTIRAGAVIVTVSTGVLRAGAIRFTPALPDATGDAIARLRMGLLSKIVLPATGADRFDIDARGGLIERRLERPGEPAIHFNAWPRQARQLIGFVGGRTAWALAADPRAAEDFARAELRSLYGARADAGLRPGAFCTNWGTDPHVLGAYAYAGPGDHGARAALARPVDGGRLIFAGEASCTDGLAGTVGGALRDGARAAEQAREHLALSENPVYPVRP